MNGRHADIAVSVAIDLSRRFAGDFSAMQTSPKRWSYIPRFASMPSTMTRSARAAAVGSSASESGEMAARPSAPAAITSRGVRHGRT
jgi:hypothetical protein